MAWARNNPDAPMDLQLSVGPDIAARHLGQRDAGQPANDQTRANETAARVAAAAARLKRRVAVGTRSAWQKRTGSGNEARGSEGRSGN